MEFDKNYIEDNQTVFPMLCVRGIVMFPSMILHFDVGREKSVLTINAAMERDRKLFLVTQKDTNVEDPQRDDIYTIGTVARVKNLLKNTNGSTRILVEGLYRAKLLDICSKDPYYEASLIRIDENQEQNIDDLETEAAVRVLRNAFSKYGNVSPRISSEILTNILSEHDPKNLFDLIIQNMVLNFKDKQVLLEENFLDKRIKLLVEIINKEILILKYELDLYEQVKERVDKSQKAYFLKEQLKVISDELGQDEQEVGEIDEYKKKIEAIKNISKEGKENLLKEVSRLKKIVPSSHEANVLRMYIETCLDLPWDKKVNSKLDIKKSEEILNADHYGLTMVKERILEFISVRKLSPNIKGQIICLVGPPGVGKTSISKSIASALGRKYVRISLGGVRDESDIRGHRKTYVGAMPGRIINALKQVKTRNPVIVLDEIDKMGMDFKGDPSSAMLEVLDSEQNSQFRDHYIEVDFDLSEVIFICTANSVESIPAPLLDRMELITLTSYTRNEKFHIAKNHLVKKQLSSHGLNKHNVVIEDEVIYKLIDNYTRESGVRRLEREIAGICRKVAKEIVSGENNNDVVVDNAKLRKMLGPEKYRFERLGKENIVGVTNGLAWTSVGGDLMQIEVTVLKGKGKLQLTGNLGNVMQESAKTAISFIRSVADEYSIDNDFYKNTDIHVHVPEGAIPKDGPSAGITITTAVLSALTGKQVRSDVAMTGEVTLRGRVLAIGGLKEKVMAAHRASINTVIIPKDNFHDLEKIDEDVKEKIEFIVVENVREVFKNSIL